TALQTGSPQPELEILQPVNLIVSVQRNLSSSWYSQIPAIQIDGDLKPMQVALSQDDLTVLMNVLFENLSEAPSLQSSAQKSGEDERETKEMSSARKQRDDGDQTFSVPPLSSGDESPAVMLKFTFNFESLSVMLYNNDACKAASEWLHDENLHLGELRFHGLSSSGMMCVDNSLDFSICLKTCTLDDLREGVTRATSRMIDQKDSSSSRNMIEISYKQGRRERSISAIMDKLYVCASVEFLMTVADFFITALHETENADKPVHSQPKASNLTKTKAERGDPAALQTLKVTAVIMDPEIVFVANLTRADAPALAVSFQGNFLLSHINSHKAMTAIVKEFKVLACPFLRDLRGNNVTTVLI
ncbi:intermembrane lipid transfer protein VPS13C-like, partial [Mantella aurantiaca]